MKATFLLVGLILTSWVNAQMNQIEFVEYDLENGLHVVLHEDHSAPVVSVGVMYHVGSKDEDSTKTGFAHFFEHLLFEGSKNIGQGEYSKMIEEVGGVSNAYTTSDFTFFHEVLPSHQVELGLWMESERMLHAQIDEAGVSVQKEVVQEEKRQTIDNRQYGTILQEVLKRLFKDHAYRWQTIGDFEHLSKATLSDFEDFYRKHYMPKNAVLTIAGDFDIKEIKQKINLYFEGIPNGEVLNAYRDYLSLGKKKFAEKYKESISDESLVSKLGSKEDLDLIKRGVNLNSSLDKDVIVQKENYEILEEIRDTIFDRIQVPAIIHAFRIPEIGSDDYYALEVMNTLLSGGNSSRMLKYVAEKKELAMNVGQINLAMEDYGVTISYALTNNGVSPSELERAMDFEYRKLKQFPVKEKELQKVKNQIESNFISGYSSSLGIAENLAKYYLLQNDANLINTELDKYLAVTIEDLTRVAKKYLNKENRITLLYLPKRKAN